MSRQRILKKQASRSRRQAEVAHRGAAILNSDIFKKTMEQKHHHISSVGVHSLAVALAALALADCLEKTGIRSDRDALVRGSLCHDLGMLDRESRYPSSFRCCFRHPGNSLEAFEKNFRPASKRERDCILHHMWPVTPAPPRTREGYIVGLADKVCSVQDVTRRVKSAVRHV